MQTVIHSRHEFGEFAAENRKGLRMPRRAAPGRPLPPCLFVTTASEEKKEEEKSPLPGPRKKQADALTENIKWMASAFGKERTVSYADGDVDAGGRYRNLRDRRGGAKAVSFTDDERGHEALPVA